MPAADYLSHVAGLQRALGTKHLYFYDAIAPIVTVALTSPTIPLRERVC